MTTLAKIVTMTTGQCRWVGREDIHVYCHNPMREVLRPDGRTAWQRTAEDARYCVVCPDAGMDYGQWMTAVDTARAVDAILAMEVEA